MSKENGQTETKSKLHEVSEKLMQLNWVQHRFFAKKLGELGLTVPQYYVLNTLLDLNGRSSMGELSRRTLQVSATMTGIVDRLVRDGLVNRVRSDRDRRLVLVEITDTGRELVMQARDAAQNSIDKVVKSLSAREQEAATKLADSLIAEFETDEV